jgi:hypothetical protein
MAKPVPAAQAVPLPHHEVSFQREGFELTRFHFDPNAPEPWMVAAGGFGTDSDVHDGGGVLRNSEGGVNEKQVLWKPARRVDFSGPITATAREGITLMDHPSNPNYPTAFHVRDNGCMGAALTFGGARSIRPAASLRLRYGLYVHAGVPESSLIQRQWEAFAKTALPELKAPASR